MIMIELPANCSLISHAGTAHKNPDRILEPATKEEERFLVEVIARSGEYIWQNPCAIVYRWRLNVTVVINRCTFHVVENFDVWGFSVS